MSLMKLSGKKDTPIQTLLSDIQANMAANGTDLVNSRYTDLVIGMESLNDSDMSTLNQAAGAMENVLRQSFETLLANTGALGLEDLSTTQLEAGVMVALAAGNPGRYASAALKNQPVGTSDIPVISAESAGIAGRLDYRTEYSPEAFDEKQLANMLPYSIVFNVQASRQDEFSETFYPTVVVSPDNGGLDITADRTTVFNAVKHNTTGKATDFKQRNLVEAAIDASILADESTALIPFVNPNGENEDKFVPNSVVSHYVREIAGVAIPTAPLRMNAKVDLLGISSHPALVGAGVIDHTDAIDSRMFLDKIYLQTATADPADAEVLRFNVSRLPRNAFNKSVEGTDREMTLNFRSEALILNADTKAVDGSDPTALDTVRTNNYTVRVGVNINGNANVEFGTIQLSSVDVEVTDITDEDGNKISMTEGAGLGIVNTLAGMKVIGYELNAARTNSNRRTRGLLLNNIRETERYAIPLGAPISAPSPIGSDRDGRDLDSLVSAARIRNSNNAVTTLLNYADTLRTYVVNRRHGFGSPNIEGVGRHMVVPFYEEMDLDLTDAINSIKSKDRAEDISAVLINAIKDIAYRMYRDSGYQAALDSSSQGNKRPTLVVGTDPIIQRHLIVQGDTRTFGIGFDNAKVVTTIDSRMDNKIVITFVREGNDGTPDPLSFGTHAWIPELTSSVLVARDGAHYQEAMVQPRSRHINNLPVMAVINVAGLTDVMTSNIPQTTVDVTP